MNGDGFQEWLETDISFLCLPHTPGSGRSMFFEAIEVIAQKTPDRAHGLAYFFFDPEHPFKQSASNMLCALLLQLSICAGGPAPGKYLGSLDLCFDLEKAPPLDILTGCLHDAAQYFRSTYILLDAFDECTLDGGREGVLATITTMRQWGLPGLLILVTGYDRDDIFQRI